MLRPPIPSWQIWPGILLLLVLYPNKLLFTGSLKHPEWSFWYGSPGTPYLGQSPRARLGSVGDGLRLPYTPQQLPPQVSATTAITLASLFVGLVNLKHKGSLFNRICLLYISFIYMIFLKKIIFW